MIVVMVMMSFGSKGTAGSGLSFGFELGIPVWIGKRIPRKRQGARLRTFSFRGKSGPRFGFAHGDSAHTAVLVGCAIAVSANSAHDRGIVRKFLGRVRRSLLRIRFRSQPLRDLQRCGQGIWTGLGSAHLRLHAAIQILQFGVARVRIGWRTGGSGISFVFVHVWNHSTLRSF